MGTALTPDPTPTTRAERERALASAEQGVVWLDFAYRMAADIDRLGEALRNAWGDLYLASMGEGDPLSAIADIRQLLDQMGLGGMTLLAGHGAADGLEVVYEGDLIPKARPRVVKGGTYMPEDYIAYRDGLAWAMVKVRKQIILQPPLRVEAVVYRRNFRRADSDNMLGTILDAMVAARWVEDDTWTLIPEVEVRVKKDAENPRVHVRAWPVTG